MNETKQYSSLPLVLSVSGATLLCAVAGWSLLGNSPGPGPTSTPAAAPVADVPAVIPFDEPDNVLLPSATVTARSPVPAGRDIDVESELRKARLAAGADMLLTPPEQNALYFYGRALSAEPGHAAASREIDTILARVALTVSDNLAAGDLQGAYETAAIVAGYRPDHPLVTVTRQAIDERANRLVAAATANAGNGNSQGAADALARLDSLPGLRPEFVSGARDTVAAATASFVTAERDRVETERLAAEQALNEWTTRVRGAIKAGQLVSPTGESARDYLAERSAPRDKADELTDELVAAMLDASAVHTEAGETGQAEALLAAATELRPDADGLAEMLDRVEQKIIQTEEARVLGLSEFVRLNTTPARYPRLANQLNITGWVDVVFTVTETGATADIEVVQAEPGNMFDESAVAAVSEWTFRPREFRGKLLNQRASARLVFRLE